MTPVIFAAAWLVLAALIGATLTWASNRRDTRTQARRDTAWARSHRVAR